jgi:hypothetical protein
LSGRNNPRLDRGNVWRRAPASGYVTGAGYLCFNSFR